MSIEEKEDSKKSELNTMEATNKENKSLRSKEEGEKTGLYLDLMTRTKPTSGVFDFSDIKNKYINQINIFISEKTIWCYRDKNDNIIILKFQKSDPDLKFLFFIRKTKVCERESCSAQDQTPESSEGFILKINKLKDNAEPNFINFNKINYYLWYVVNSESEQKNQIINDYNEDYYLQKGDIIKIGHIKFIVKEIVIKDDKNNDAEKKEDETKEINKSNKQIFNLDVKYIDCKICEICGEEIFQFCKCNKDHYEHFGCYKKWFDERKIIFKNSKGTVKNYIFDIYKCNNETQELDEDEEHKRCDTFYPLKFKYKINEETKYKELESIERFEDSSYMILESFEHSDMYKNSSKYKKTIHVIKLTEENDITIGSENSNDIFLNNSSVCPQHAVIKYKDKKILIKNRSKITGTLVLIRDGDFAIKEKKEIALQIDKTFFKAQIMKEEDFLNNKKNDYTQTPLTKEEFEKKIMEEKNNNSLNNNKDDNSDTFYIKEEASKSSIFYN